MRRNLPESVVVPGHPDFRILSELEAEILAGAGGQARFRSMVPEMLRECVDDVIQTARTGRRAYKDLEKTEKTYIGTRVEIMLRAFLRLPKGRLDLRIGQYDVDVKHTMGGNWMIPSEAIGHFCILVAADEERSLCYMGLFAAKPEYLSPGTNKDGKRTLTPLGFANILWLLNGEHYPPNFWRTVAADIVEEIFAGTTGNDRMAALFRLVQDRPLARPVIEAVAQQPDFMRRIRADNGRGTRDILAREGIVLLSGKYDQSLINRLGLKPIGTNEFISRTIQTEAEAALARACGFGVPWPIN